MYLHWAQRCTQTGSHLITSLFYNNRKEKKKKLIHYVRLFECLGWWMCASP